MKKFLLCVMFIIMSAIILWFIASCVDIMSDNIRPNPVHHEWNFFNILIDSAKEMRR